MTDSERLARIESVLEERFRGVFTRLEAIERKLDDCERHRTQTCLLEQRLTAHEQAHSRYFGFVVGAAGLISAAISWVKSIIKGG